LTLSFCFTARHKHSPSLLARRSTPCFPRCILSLASLHNRQTSTLAGTMAKKKNARKGEADLGAFVWVRDSKEGRMEHPAHLVQAKEYVDAAPPGTVCIQWCDRGDIDYVSPSQIRNDDDSQQGHRRRRRRRTSSVHQQQKEANDADRSSNANDKAIHKSTSNRTSSKPASSKGRPQAQKLPVVEEVRVFAPDHDDEDNISAITEIDGFSPVPKIPYKVKKPWGRQPKVLPQKKRDDTNTGRTENTTKGEQQQRRTASSASASLTKRPLVTYSSREKRRRVSLDDVDDGRQQNDEVVSTADTFAFQDGASITRPRSVKKGKLSKRSTRRRISIITTTTTITGTDGRKPAEPQTIKLAKAATIKKPSKPPPILRERKSPDTILTPKPSTTTRTKDKNSLQKQSSAGKENSPSPIDDKALPEKECLPSTTTHAMQVVAAMELEKIPALCDKAEATTTTTEKILVASSDNTQVHQKQRVNSVAVEAEEHILCCPPDKDTRQSPNSVAAEAEEQISCRPPDKDTRQGSVKEAEKMSSRMENDKRQIVAAETRAKPVAKGLSATNSKERGSISAPHVSPKKQDGPKVTTTNETTTTQQSQNIGGSKERASIQTEKLIDTSTRRDIGESIGALAQKSHHLFKKTDESSSSSSRQKSDEISKGKVSVESSSLPMKSCNAASRQPGNVIRAKENGIERRDERGGVVPRDLLCQKPAAVASQQQKKLQPSEILQPQPRTCTVLTDATNQQQSDKSSPIQKKSAEELVRFVSSTKACSKASQMSLKDGNQGPDDECNDEIVDKEARQSPGNEAPQYPDDDQDLPGTYWDSDSDDMQMDEIVEEEGEEECEKNEEFQSMGTDVAFELAKALYMAAEDKARTTTADIVEAVEDYFETCLSSMAQSQLEHFIAEFVAAYERGEVEAALSADGGDNSQLQEEDDDDYFEETLTLFLEQGTANIFGTLSANWLNDNITNLALFAGEGNYTMPREETLFGCIASLPQVRGVSIYYGGRDLQVRNLMKVFTLKSAICKLEVVDAVLCGEPEDFLACSSARCDFSSFQELHLDSCAPSKAASPDAIEKWLIEIIIFAQLNKLWLDNLEGVSPATIAKLCQYRCLKELGLRCMPVPKSLFGAENLTKLHLIDCPDTMGALYFSALPPTLKEVFVWGEVTEASGISFIRMLHANPTLERLSLTITGGPCLCTLGIDTLVTQNKCLLQLNLILMGFVSNVERGAQEIAEAVAKNKTMECLRIYAGTSNEISDEKMQLLLTKSLRRNRSLKTLEMFGIIWG
jgi:hypothetical protein